MTCFEWLRLLGCVLFVLVLTFCVVFVEFWYFAFLGFRFVFVLIIVICLFCFTCFALWLFQGCLLIGGDWWIVSDVCLGVVEYAVVGWCWCLVLICRFIVLF